MKTVRVDYNVAYVPEPNEAHIILDEALPPADLITSALVLAFEGDRLLLPRLVKRGWDIPGGHVEPGETPLQTVRREVYEETFATLGHVALLGYHKLVVKGAAPAGYKYPSPVSYQIFYWGRVAGLDPFTPNHEVAERGLFAPAEARRLEWVQRFSELYAAAVDKAAAYTGQ